MEFLIILLLLIFVVPVLAVLQAGLFRLVADWVADEEVGWLMALLTVLVAGGAQSLAMGALLGGDGGLCGTIFGFFVWSGVVTLLNGIDLAKSLVIGLVLTVVQWALTAGFAVLLLITGIGAALGLAAML